MDKQQEDIERLFQQLFTSGKGNEYLDITNSVGQRYLVPVNSPRAGLSLYRPCRTMGKMMKQLVPLLRCFPFLLARMGVRRRMLDTSSAFQQRLTKTFGHTNLVLAVFCGTPGPHRKITVQVSVGNETLGYAKISNRPAVHELFTQENDLLNYLRQQGIYNIPQALFCGNVSPDVRIFMQDTLPRERPVYGYNEPLIWEFLTELRDKTAVDIPFVESGFYLDLQRLKAEISLNLGKKQVLLESVIREVTDFFQEHTTRFSVYHGDFTCWNMFVHKGQLYVFDWEYSRQAYPPFLDYFHFFTQYAFYQKQWNTAKTIRKFNAMQANLKQHISDPVLYYKAYLLTAIGFYTDRDQGDQGNDCRFRISLLETLARSNKNNDGRKKQ